jgi:hypothetical protein
MLGSMSHEFCFKVLIILELNWGVDGPSDIPMTDILYPVSGLEENQCNYTSTGSVDWNKNPTLNFTTETVLRILELSLKMNHIYF